jgi:hypothetical protein
MANDKNQAPDIRDGLAEKFTETLNALVPVFVDLIMEDFFVNRDEATIKADTDLLVKFNETYKAMIGNDSGFDAQLTKIREIKGKDYVASVERFRKERNKSDEASDAQKAAKVKF